MSSTDPGPGHTYERRVDPEAARIIRRQAMWTAIAAVLLLVFGFGFQVRGLFLAGQILEYTLKIGAFLMIISTVLLLTGAAFALIVDGFFTIAIGAALAVSGVIWLIKAPGLQGILNIVFGYLFASAGWHNFKLHRSFTGQGGGGAMFPVENAAAPTATAGDHDASEYDEGTETDSDEPEKGDVSSYTEHDREPPGT